MRDRSLDDLLKNPGERCAFSPYTHYTRDGDCLHIYVSETEAIRRRVDDVLTVYESRKDGEFVGCLIKGVRRLLRDAEGGWGINIFKGEKLKASVVLLAYAGERPLGWESISPRAKEDLRRVAREQELCLN